MDLPALLRFAPTEGRLVLFPSTLFHGTTPVKKGERLTVAFDLVPG
jgi:predicted 2-oxoglutarate/Fe(II)-dependent dioxygenase YbiX